MFPMVYPMFPVLLFPFFSPPALISTYILIVCSCFLFFFRCCFANSATAGISRCRVFLRLCFPRGFRLYFLSLGGSFRRARKLRRLGHLRGRLVRRRLPQKQYAHGRQGPVGVPPSHGGGCVCLVIVTKRLVGCIVVSIFVDIVVNIVAIASTDTCYY